jgi:hypothetical protein
MDAIPSKEEIMNLSTFDKIIKTEYGRLLYIGTDEFGAQVYTLCRRHSKRFVIPAISDMYEILNGNKEGFFQVNTSPTVNNLMRIGGFSSRGLGLISFGRPIAAKGIQKNYAKLVNLVKTTKDYMNKHM